LYLFLFFFFSSPLFFSLAVEFKRQYLNYQPAVGDAALLREALPVRKAKHSSAIPASYDWRTPDQGRPVAVTAVKDQG
jgi:hypothetical protein